MKSDWQVKKLSDIVEFNPTERLPKGAIAKKIPMDILQPFTKDIFQYELQPYNGGAKFRNGDTIMARITPCLENGKVSKVNILTQGEVGFGSTEYIVLRAIPNVSDPDFIYYLTISDLVRAPAIKSMVGSSGRQRVQQNVLETLELPIPPYDEQKKIAAILSALDEKIATNRAINDNLANLLQTAYQKQFGDVSKAATQGILSDICSYSREKVAVAELNVSTYFSTENMLPGKAGATEATSLPTTPMTTACHKGDTLISNIRPYFKKIVYCADECGCSTDVLCFTPSLSRYAAYLFSTLYADKFFAFMVAGSKGTKMPRGDKQQIMTYPVALPSDEELEEFNALALPILTHIHSNRGENERLAAVRDALLPKLMSGEIDVSDIQL